MLDAQSVARQPSPLEVGPTRASMITSSRERQDSKWASSYLCLLYVGERRFVWGKNLAITSHEQKESGGEEENKHQKTIPNDEQPKLSNRPPREVATSIMKICQTLLDVYKRINKFGLFFLPSKESGRRAGVFVEKGWESKGRIVYDNSMVLQCFAWWSKELDDSSFLIWFSDGWMTGTNCATTLLTPLSGSSHIITKNLIW